MQQQINNLSNNNGIFNGNQSIKTNQTSLTFDKENSSLSSNIHSNIMCQGLLDRKQIPYKDTRKSNEIVFKSHIPSNQNDSISLNNVSQSTQISLNQSKYVDEIDNARLNNMRRVKKCLTFESRNNIYTENCSHQNTLHNQDHEKHNNNNNNNNVMPPIPENKVIPIEKEKKVNDLIDIGNHHHKQDKEIKTTVTSGIVVDTLNKKSTFDFKGQQIKAIEPYFGSIIESLKVKDVEFTPTHFLKKHKIPSNLRAKMVDWMIEVLSSYKCSDQTFFIAVNFMDLYLQKTPLILEVSDLHLIGVTSMFMASKYEEIYPLRLSIVYEKIAHKKLSIDSIKKKEKEILQALDFKLTGVTPYEFMMTALYQMNTKEKMNDKAYEYLQRVCTYLSKMTMHDYDLINQQQYSELAASTLFVAFKIIEQLDKTFPLNRKFKQLINILNVNDEVVLDCATKILSMAKNFDKIYPNFENLKKFHSFNIESNPLEKKINNNNNVNTSGVSGNNTLNTSNNNINMNKNDK